MGMDSLSDLLRDRVPAQPDEIVAVKKFILDEFDAEVHVAIKGEALLITAHSASLANALRMRLPDLQAAANTTKRFIFRIG